MLFRVMQRPTIGAIGLIMCRHDKVIPGQLLRDFNTENNFKKLLTKLLFNSWKKNKEQDEFTERRKRHELLNVDESRSQLSEASQVLQEWCLLSREKASSNTAHSFSYACSTGVSSVW